MVIILPNNYNSSFTGAHNDDYDTRITANANNINTKVSKSGDTMTGDLILGVQGGAKTIFEYRYTGTNNLGRCLRIGSSNPGDYITIKRTTDSATDGLTEMRFYDDHIEMENTLAIKKNGITCSIGAENNGFVHFMVSNPVPFYFNNHLSVNGNIEIYNNYNFALQKAGGSSSYYNGRDTALVRITGAGGYRTLASLKTTNGTWCIGHYDSSSAVNRLQFVYTTDANYNSGTNTNVIASITAAGAFTNASKREYKENIQLFQSSGLDIINSVKICSFNMKGDEAKDYRIGFIADDTDERIAGKNHDIMDLQNCIGVLIKAVQELSNKVNTLENKIKELS